MRATEEYAVFSVIKKKKMTKCSFSIFFLISLSMYISSRKWSEEVGESKIRQNINVCMTVFIVTIVIQILFRESNKASGKLVFCKSQ